MPKKNQEEKKPEVKKPAEIEKPKLSDEARTKAEQIQAENAEIARLNTEKAHKDVLLKNAEELRQHIIALKKEAQVTGDEVQSNVRAVKRLQDEMQALNGDLARRRELFEKQNTKAIADLAKGQADTDASNKEYQALIQETAKLRQELRNETGKLNAERLEWIQKLNTSDRLVKDTIAESDKLKADLVKREEQLQTAIEAHAEEQDSLKPEFKKLSEAQNQHKVLSEQLASDNLRLERDRKAVESHRVKLDEEALVGKKQLEDEILKLRNEEARLRQWEKDLEDLQLELNANQAEAKKQLKRFQLNKVVNEKE